MKVKCVAASLSPEQKVSLGASEHFDSVYQITIGSIYPVLGLSFIVRSKIFGSTALVYIQVDSGNLIPVPMCLFEIVDPRPSSYWRAKVYGGFDLLLRPEEFHERYFHDDLSNGVAAVRIKYKAVFDRMEKGFR
jgi:hypothetical protein